EGQWPVLLTRLPYGKDFPLGSSVLNPAQAARRGYVVIVQDTRGRFTSEGEWSPMVMRRWMEWIPSNGPPGCPTAMGKWGCMEPPILASHNGQQQSISRLHSK